MVLKGRTLLYPTHFLPSMMTHEGGEGGHLGSH